MSNEEKFEEFEVDDQDGQDVCSEIEEEILFSKETQELQSSTNKRRLLELQRKVSQLQHKQFNIHIGEISFIKAEDLLHKEVLLVYAKGLARDWEFPLFSFYIMHRYADESFKLEKLLKLILDLLFAVNLHPLACIMDWCPAHEKLMNDLGITVYNPYIEVNRRRTMLCLDFFKDLKKSYLNSSIPSDILDFMKYFDKECDNLENWQAEFRKFKTALENAYNIGIQVFVLYYAVASRVATLELAKMGGVWPLKMVSLRQTKMDLFLYRIELENFNDYDEFLKALPNIHREYY